MKIVKLLFPLTLLIFAACSMNNTPKEIKMYDSKSLVKYCEKSLEYDDLIGETSIIIQTSEESMSKNSATYLDSILTSKMITTEIPQESNLTNDDLVLVDYSKLTVDELKIKYHLSSKYLILISPVEAFNYYDFQRYVYFDNGSRMILDPFIDKNIDYADSLKWNRRVSTFESSRLISRIRFYSLDNNALKMDIELINNEFYTTHFKSDMTVFSPKDPITTEPNVKKILSLFPDDVLSNILFLKHSNVRRNQIYQIVNEELTEYDEIFDIVSYLNLEIRKEQFNYKISNGKKSMYFPKEDGFIGDNSSNREELKKIVLSNNFYPTIYDEGYEIPDDKKRPLKLNMDMKKVNPAEKLAD